MRLLKNGRVINDTKNLKTNKIKSLKSFWFLSISLLFYGLNIRTIASLIFLSLSLLTMTLVQYTTLVRLSH